MRRWRLPARFSAKPYHSRAPPLLADAALLHFAGPSASDLLAAAAALAGAGAHVTLIARSQQEITEAADALRHTGAHADAHAWRSRVWRIASSLSLSLSLAAARVSLSLV